MASKEEKGLYEVAPDAYLTKNLARYLKRKKIEPRKFFSEKIEPYMTALSSRKYVFVVSKMDTEGMVIVPIFPKDIKKDRGDIVARETSDYETWMKRVEDIVTDATSYIM